MICSMQWVLISIKDPEDNDGVIFFDGKMDGIGGKYRWLGVCVFVADGRSGG